MRDYGKVHNTFWSSDTLKGLSDDARFLALYLLTCPHGNIAGVFRLPVAYAIEDTGWTSERLRNGFETLSDAGFIRRDSSGWTWIVKWLKWNKPDNGNQWKAVEKQIAQVPASVSFHAELMSPRETVSEPLGNLPSPSPSVVVSEKAMPAIPLDDGTDYVVPEQLAAELKAAFPNVDLAAELAKARVWCVANPGQRKTRRGVGKFLNGWMGRAAKDAAANTVPTPPRRLKELA
jgi:hypothetical protein